MCFTVVWNSNPMRRNLSAAIWETVLPSFKMTTRWQDERKNPHHTAVYSLCPYLRALCHWAHQKHNKMYDYTGGCAHLTIKTDNVGMFAVCFSLVLSLPSLTSFTVVIFLFCLSSAQDKWLNNILAVKLLLFCTRLNSPHSENRYISTGWVSFEEQHKDSPSILVTSWGVRIFSHSHLKENKCCSMGLSSPPISMSSDVSPLQEVYFCNTSLTHSVN